jgi:aldose sugar dehydrogenase
VNRKHILTGISAAGGGYHNGGQLEFVGGKLFVSTGEQHDPGFAQDTGNRLGKVLRYNADGSVPRGNPFSVPGNRNPVWSYGHRNPFGLTHKPGSSAIFETENGPSCDDEFNRIRKGRNYGWGNGYSCGTAGVGPNPKGPMRRWGTVVVPTDPWWYEGRLGRLDGDVYVGDFSQGRLHRLLLNRSGTELRGDRVIYNAPAGITDVSKGPGGWLYFLTSNAIYRVIRD